MLDQIATAEPRPPRQIDDTIPRELERICQKALAKRASERYSTGRDLADDLRHFLQTDAASGSPAAAPEHGQPAARLDPGGDSRRRPRPARSDSDGRAVKIVPKGLRSFDQHDADFFLELLPGPRDRDGLPESLRFWKTRIESTDPDTTFRVGLIYGPSGCGKSSLVKAGLLPRLGKHVLPVYIEATPEETEARLLQGPAQGLSRPARRAGPGRRAGRAAAGPGAAARPEGAAGPRPVRAVALRPARTSRTRSWSPPCGSATASTSRRSSWSATTSGWRRPGSCGTWRSAWSKARTRPPSTSSTCCTPARSWRRSAGPTASCPRSRPSSPPTSEAFLEQSVAGLAQDGKVISVRLALFAEMVKGKPWTPATLREVGGTEGVGVTFLEETFSASTAPPEHRLHQKAAQAVLKALLPQSGTDIKGQMRSEAELRDASGYASRPRDFDDLIRILDPELRLITPTDPEGSSERAARV